MNPGVWANSDIAITKWICWEYPVRWIVRVPEAELELEISASEALGLFPRVCTTHANTLKRQIKVRFVC